MDIVIKLRAMNAMEKVAAYVEETNTSGSGNRWLDKVKTEIYTLAKSKAKLALCKNPSRARVYYRCYTYNDWIIAYRISETKFEVCRFIWGPRLR